jgi:Domain of Unknown Function (DUF1259)
MRLKLSAFASLFLLFVAVPAGATEIDWSKVDATIGKSAAVSGTVHRYGLPRTDLHVTLDGVDIKPGFALGGWIAFEPMGDTAMMMGDLVLTESEINPVMAKLLASGVDVTPIHNHLLRVTPATFYMHVGGAGDPAVLAQAVRAALAESKTPFGPPGAPVGATPPDLGFDTAKVDEALGFKGKNNNGIYQFGVPRTDTIKMGGMAIAAAMGGAIVINFEPTGDGNAAITGDFVALASDVVPLLKALQSNGIEVTAVHNHMLDDEPRAFFIHFWANDDALKLAKGLRAGLDAVHVAPKG